MLNTARLQLHPLTPADADPLHALWTSPGVRRFLWDDEIIPVEKTREIVETSAALFRDRGLGLFAARARGMDALVGVSGFWFFRNPPELELLYCVAETEWRRGYAMEIAHAVLDYGFDVLKLPVIRATTDVGNLASTRVLEKLGFTFDRRETIHGLDTLFYSKRLG